MSSTRKLLACIDRRYYLMYKPGMGQRLRRTRWPGRVPLLGALLLAMTAAFGGGCSRPPPVKSWQREHLTRRAMSFDDRLEARFRQHMFSSREGADGGYGHVGGGCGCN